ncbi:hypothetical protein [Pseudomonas lini]
MDTKEPLEQGVLFAQAGFNELQNQFLTDALDQYSVMLKQSITRKDGEYANWALDKQQGRIAEAHHTGSYNIEAAGKGANNCAFHAIRPPSPPTSGHLFHAHPARQSERSDAGLHC